MPLTYKRKSGVCRGEWTESALTHAFQAVSNGMGINEAPKTFGIPKTTFKRRLAKNNFTKSDVLGPSGILLPENEKKIVMHITKLQKSGFAPSREAVRKMAYNLAERLHIKHNFNHEKKMAGNGWLKSFLRRNIELSIRQSEGVSVARAKGMNKEYVDKYFNHLEEVLKENELFDKPGSIFNMDETGLQLNNKPGKVVAVKGSKNVPNITAGEKGETISVIACCSGEGVFLPPYCIFKGKNKKPEFEDGMPPGSVVTMSQKSAYVNSEIFFDWLKHHFLPRKPQGKCLLILDGHSSHCSNVEMLKFAEENGIILVCLPSHTTHFLQPLDRTFFKSLKCFYYDECNKFITTNPSRKLTRLQFGKILASAWNKSASVSNATSGFSATGIIPFNKHAIPDYAFLTSSNQNNDNMQQTAAIIQHNQPTEESALAQPETVPKPSTSKAFSRQTAAIIQHDQPTKESALAQPATVQKPSTSNAVSPKTTPGKILDMVSPIPIIEKTAIVRHRSRKIADILNSTENIQNLKENQSRKTKKVNSTETKQTLKVTQKKKGTKRQISAQKENKRQKKKYEDSSDEDSEQEIITLRDSPELTEWDDNECAGCGENYEDTLSQDEWLLCIICERWSHEGCTNYPNMCDRCGNTVTN